MYAVFDISDGHLYAISRSIPTNLPPGRNYVEVPGYGDGWEWDPIAKTMQAVPVPRYILTTDFLNRFSVAEREALYTGQSTDPRIQDFLYRIPLHERVDLDSPDVTDGIDYLISVGIIDPARKSEILA